MVVYKITSKLNNKCYIGITNDFNRRMREHKTLHSKNSLIEQAIQLDGVDNFIYEIIEKDLSLEEAQEKEISYIKKFNSRFPNGYNYTSGGELMMGTNNGRAEFSLSEIIDIRERFNNDENYLDIYQDYKKVSLGQFLKILRNKTYIDCPVKAKEKSLYNQGYLTKLKTGKLKFSKEEIEYFRTQWKNLINYKEVYQDYKDICSLEYFYQVYYGILYKDIMPEVFTPELKKAHSSLSHSGENNSKAKLKKEDVIKIRELYRNKIKTQSALAKEYQVSVGTINNIVNYKTWRNL